MNNITVDELMEIIFAEPDNGCLRAILESLIKDQERLEFFMASGAQIGSYKEKYRTVMPPHDTGEWFDTPREAIDDAIILKVSQ